MSLRALYMVDTEADDDTPQPIKIGGGERFSSTQNPAHDKSFSKNPKAAYEIDEENRVLSGEELPDNVPTRVISWDSHLLGEQNRLEFTKSLRRVAPEFKKSYEAIQEHRRKRQCLPPQALKDWIVCWDISLREAAAILHVTRAALIKYKDSDEDFLPYKISRRLRLVRWRAKREVMSESFDPTDEIGVNGIGYTIRIVPIKRREYLLEAYTHGLWPRDLVYYRGRAHWQARQAQIPVACIVVHTPSGCWALAETAPSFHKNRSIAEGRLATKVAYWATHPTARLRHKFEKTGVWAPKGGKAWHLAKARRNAVAVENAQGKEKLDPPVRRQPKPNPGKFTRSPAEERALEEKEKAEEAARQRRQAAVAKRGRTKRSGY